jgi:hypothetical protein
VSEALVILDMLADFRQECGDGLSRPFFSNSLVTRPN